MQNGTERKSSRCGPALRAAGGCFCQRSRRAGADVLDDDVSASEMAIRPRCALKGLSPPSACVPFRGRRSGLGARAATRARARSRDDGNSPRASAACCPAAIEATCVCGVLSPSRFCRGPRDRVGSSAAWAARCLAGPRSMLGGRLLGARIWS